MSKNSSVAPKERVNITYVPATGDMQSEVELPLKTLVIGDFKGHPEDSTLEDRQSVCINKNNFQSIMSESNLSLNLSVPNKLVDDDGGEESNLSFELNFKSMSDFSPDAIAEQIPELNKLLELREALVALKGPMGNIPAFRNRLKTLLESDESRIALLKELGII